jgi:hypothetical protein
MQRNVMAGEVEMRLLTVPKSNPRKMAGLKDCRTDAQASTSGTSLIPPSTLENFGTAFEAPMTPGQVCTFVNFGPGFALHNPEMASLVSLFWKQLDWIQPESYIADADMLLTFVSRNADIFVAVRNALNDIALNS